MAYAYMYIYNLSVFLYKQTFENQYISFLIQNFQVLLVLIYFSYFFLIFWQLI